MALDCFASLAMMVVVMTATIARAEEIDRCRLRCESYAASDRKVCADLPPNPSCRSVVEKNRLRCLDYCEQTVPHPPDRPGMHGNDIKS